MEEILLIDISRNRVPAAAAWIERRCHRFGLSEADGYKVRTCVVEAMNNSFERAYSGGRGTIRIVTWCKNGHVNVEVSDFGSAPGTNLNGHGDAAAPNAERGPGWFIMKAWMNEANFSRTDGANIVRLAKRIAH